MISEVIVAVFMLEALRSCAPERENVVRSSRRLSNQEPREIESNFMYCVELGALYFVLGSWVFGLGQDPSTKTQDSYFLLIPRWMMLCISSEFGIPSSVAGLRPNGPPSVFAMNVMLSPVAYA